MAGTGRGSKDGKRGRPLAAPRRAAAKAPARRAAPRRRARASRGGPLSWPGRALRWAAGLLFGFTWRIGLIAALILAAAVAWFAVKLPPATELVDGRTRGSVTMLDRDGRVFAWRGDQFGGVVRVADMAPALPHAVVATEDRRFYRHPGIDPIGIASAIRINLSEGRGPLSGHGGSTITQQTAKLLCLGVPFDPEIWASEAEYEADCRRTTMTRKIREAVYALALEARYTKDEILTIYMNRAFLGAGARGVEAAAQRYFGQSAAEVDASEAAVIAGLLVAPSRYAPTNDLGRSNRRAATVIRLMEEQGYLTPAEADIARARPAELSRAAAAREGGYFADWVMASGPDFFTSDTTEDITIRTTLDPAIQAASEAALVEVFATKVRPGSEAEAAIVVMSADGAVRAMVGGRDLRSQGGFNRAVQARRQTGSAFKPFVYAAALDLGYGANDTVVDEPITLQVPGSGAYSPRNYTNDFKGRVTLTEALAQSLNIPAVKISESVGRENVRKVAGDFGLQSDLALGPALALGASESTLIEMTGAYAGILNGGSSVTPYGLVELSAGGDPEPVIRQTGGMGERVISTRAAQELTWMMHQVVERGTGARAALPDGREAAAKTGTTQAARDAWFVGFTDLYVAGIWMGYDDNRPLSGVTGGGLPADIWRETMARIHQGVPLRPLPMTPPQAAERYTEAPAAPAAPAPTTARELAREADGGAGTIERVLTDVLRSILPRN